MTAGKQTQCSLYLHQGKTYSCSVVLLRHIRCCLWCKVPSASVYDHRRNPQSSNVTYKGHATKSSSCSMLVFRSTIPKVLALVLPIRLFRCSIHSPCQTQKYRAQQVPYVRMKRGVYFLSLETCIHSFVIYYICCNLFLIWTLGNFKVPYRKVAADQVLQVYFIYG